MRFFLLVIASLAVAAQNPGADFSVGGTVVNAQTAEAVRNALVSLTATSTRQKLSTMTMLTGMGGEYLFTGIAEGTYQLRSQKPGFTPESALTGIRSTEFIELKASVLDRQLKLSPLGVIEGQVLDQYGEPASGVNVLALSVKIEDGVRTSPSERAVSTNDQGRYRLWNLSPGKYYIKAAGKSGGTFSYTGSSATLGDGWEGFAPVFAGGASELNSAVPVVIGPGTHAQADVRIVRERAFKIHGTLGNFVPHQTVKFELRRGDEVVSSSRSTLNGTTGKFDILDVTPGHYLLRATQAGKTRGEAIVTVAERDVNDVSMLLAPAVEARVILHASAGPTVESKLRRKSVKVPRGAFCSIQLHSSDGTSGPSTSVHSSNPEAVIRDILPGDYRVGLQCGGEYVSTVTAGRDDLVSNPRLTIRPGVTPEPIEITLKPGAASLSGLLALSPRPPNPAILLVPGLGALPGPVVVRVFSTTLRDLAGKFVFSDLAPGDYVAYAFSSSDDIEYRNPAFLQSLRGGTAIQLAEGEHKEIEITGVVQ